MKEIAKISVGDLAERAQWLEGKCPREGQAGEDAFCAFWAEDVYEWGEAVAKILREAWGSYVADDFLSDVGLNYQEPTGNVHKSATAAYCRLLHRQRTLKNIRRTLS